MANHLVPEIESLIMFRRNRDDDMHRLVGQTECGPSPLRGLLFAHPAGTQNLERQAHRSLALKVD